MPDSSDQESYRNESCHCSESSDEVCSENESGGSSNQAGHKIAKQVLDPVSSEWIVDAKLRVDARVLDLLDPESDQTFRDHFQAKYIGSLTKCEQCPVTVQCLLALFDQTSICFEHWRCTHLVRVRCYIQARKSSLRQWDSWIRRHACADVTVTMVRGGIEGHPDFRNDMHELNSHGGHDGARKRLKHLAFGGD